MCKDNNSTINNIIMKIKHLLIGMLAIAATAACNRPDEPVVEPKLDVDKAAVEVAATAGEASFNVTSNQSWVASADQDWVSLEPASGAASEKAVAVKVTAEDNETTEAREATVTVKAGELTKTVKVTQAAGQGGETPGPELPASEWALVGSFNNWDATSDAYLSVLDEDYLVYYGFEMDESTEFKFLKGGAWPPAGTEIGGNGLVEPNTIQPAGGSNIKVTVAGKYDIYLAADLSTFYIMSEGKLPAEATEPSPVENQWSMMGCFVDNQWASDVPMTKEGEWIVAKGAQFTELTFKIRANQSWADATNIGVAPGSERGYVNGKVSVVTAEYSKANLGGDAADIKLDGAAGTYDVYFSFENLEVYVMEQGAKPGEKEPIVPEVPTEITYTVVGTLDGINWNNAAPEGLMTKDGDYYVGKNVPLVTAATLYGGANQIEFKIVETGTWTGYGVAAGTAAAYANAEIAVTLGGDNIPVVAAEGAYDVYLDKENGKVWVMEPGFKPGEKEPVVPSEPAKDVYRVTGTIADNAWAPGSEIGLLVEEGDYLVAKNLPLVWGRSLYSDNSNPIEFKITKNGGWDGYGEAADVVSAANTEIAVALGGDNIVVDAPEGTYDVYFDLANAKVWVMNAGLKPGETPAEPEPEYSLEGKQWLFSQYYLLVDVGLYEEDAMVIALPKEDGSGFGVYMYGMYEIEKTDATSGNVVFYEYDPMTDDFKDPVSFPYSELSESVVYISLEAVLGDPTAVPFVALDTPYELIFDEAGGEDPEGPVANGEYWFFNGTKVMAPLAEGETSGVLPAGNVIDGASTVKNIFTLTYDPDMSYYTIQDSYGRYLGQTDETGNVTVTNVLPTDETYAYYLWCIETGYGEACSIYNAAYYYDITYSASQGNWVLVDGGYDYPETLPTLVLAENPVEEPVGPKVVTVAEFLAAPEDDTEYQLTGVIKGTYNTTYGNFYLVDETGEVCVYGLTATPQASNDKSFASLGLRDGDTLTLVGKRDSYNGTAQVGGPAYYVSHVAAPFLELSQETAFVDYDATSYTLKVESNLDWMVVPSATVTTDKTAGSGNGEIVLSFTANETATPVDHLVVVMAGTITRTFTLTQRAKPAEGAPVVLLEEDFSSLKNWSTNNATTIKANDLTWTSAGGSMYEQKGCIKFGKSTAAANTGVKLPTLSGLTEAANVTLTFKAVSSDSGYTMKVSATGGATVGTLSPKAITKYSGGAINSGADTATKLADAFAQSTAEFTVTIENVTSETVITIVADGSAKRWYLDDVKIVAE